MVLETREELGRATCQVREAVKWGQYNLCVRPLSFPKLNTYLSSFPSIKKSASSTTPQHFINKIKHNVILSFPYWNSLTNLKTKSPKRKKDIIMNDFMPVFQNSRLENNLRKNTLTKTDKKQKNLKRPIGIKETEL